MLLIQKDKSKEKSLHYNQMGILNCFNDSFLSIFKLGLSFLVMLIAVSSASQTGTTVGFLPTFGEGDVVHRTTNGKNDQPKAATFLQPHFDNPTPSASKFTLNGQFVTSDSQVVISSSDTDTIVSTTTTATIPTDIVIPLEKTTFYDFDLKKKGIMSTSSLSPSITKASIISTASTFPIITASPPPSIHISESEKVSDINLLRKLQLWSSSRSSKLNLTQEHQALLRIETKPNITTSSSSWRFISTTTPGTLSVDDKLSTPISTMTSKKLTNTDEIKLESGTPEQFPTSLPRRHPPNPIRRLQIVYPEWLSSGGVYPDDNNDNGTAVDYFAEAEPPPDYNDQQEQQQLQQQENPISSFSDPGEAQEENPNRQDSLLSSAFRKRIRINDNEDELDMPEREISGGGGGQSLIDRSRGDTIKDGLGGSLSTRSPQDLLFPQVEVDPDDGLADVISRGRIDSVKYVYFGDKYNDYHKEEIAGRIIQAVGGVVAAIAQVLTVLGAAKCIRKGGSYNTPPVQLHIGFALLISNLLLLLAVHATEPVDVCASVAVILHYLHLVIGCWLLGHTVQTYRTLQRQVNAPNLLTPDATAPTTELLVVPFGQRTVSPTTLPYCVITWAAPIPFIITSYLVSPDGYETRSYCWMSLEKGMLVSFIVPVFLLIGLNTSLVVLSLRHLLALQKLCTVSSNRTEPSQMSERLPYPSHFPSHNNCTCSIAGSTEEILSLLEKSTSTTGRSLGFKLVQSYRLEKEMRIFLDGKAISGGIRASAMLLPLLAIMWFLGVVALENPTSIFFQLTASAANIALSWLVMYFLGDEVFPLWCPFRKSNPNLSSSECNGSLTSIQPSGAIQLSFDNEPLIGGSTSGVQPGTSSGHSSSSFKPWRNKPNWSRPGDEIYELRHDAISTICK